MPMNWSAANEGFDAIQKAMIDYHKRHVAYDQQQQLAQALSQIGISENGNLTRVTGQDGKAVKGITPIIDPKALELFTAKTASGRDQAIGGLKALNQLAVDTTKSAIISGIKQRLGETGLAGDVKRSQIGASKTRATLNNARAAQVLGLIPKPIVPPTGGQLIAEQRAQRNALIKQQGKAFDALFIQKVGDQNITDPSMLLDDKNIQFGEKDSYNRFYPKPPDFKYKSGKYAMIPGGKDDGTDLLIPFKQFQRLRKQAETWKGLGDQAAALQTNHAMFNQAWGSINPQQQQVAVQKLMANPTPEMKALFDKRFNSPGAADMILNSTGKTSSAAAPPAQQDEADASADENAQPDNSTDDSSDDDGTDITP